MAVGAPATKLHLSTAAAARRPSLLHLAAVAVLCSVSYLLGIWHNGGFSAAPSGGAAPSVSTATAASVSCVSPTPNVLGGGGGSSSSSSAPLDFAAHHTAEAPHRGGDGGGVRDGAAQVLLTTPTAPTERMKEISKASEGFVYLVSAVGVTGPRPNVNPHVKDLLQEIKQVTDKAVAVGFGISTPDHVRQIAEWGVDGVIIGSAILQW